MPDWIVFLIAGVSLYFVYGFDIKRLLETLLQWAFAVSGVKLLIDYGLIKELLSKEKVDDTLQKIPFVSNLATKKFRYK